MRVTTVTEGTVDLDGGTLSYETAGEGPPVVLIHPGLWDRRTWDDQFGVFANEHLWCGTTSGGTGVRAARSRVVRTRTSGTSRR